MSVGWRLRAARSALFAVVCVTLAALGHALMSEAPLPGWVLGLGLAGAAVPAWLLAGRERGQATVVALTVAAQASLHAVFTFAQTARPPAAADGGGRTPAARWAEALLCGPSHDTAAAARAHDVAARAWPADSMPLPRPDGGASAMAALGHTGHGARTAGTEVVQSGHDMAAMTGTASWGMLAAHVVAALLCGLWLARGEHAAFQVLRSLADRFRLPLALFEALRPLPSAPPGSATDRSATPPRSRLLVHTRVTRGPPWEIAVR